MKISETALNIFNKIKQDKIFVYSSHASFYILISSIPFITLFISLIKIFSRISEYKVIEILISFFPDASISTLKMILEEVFLGNSGEFLSFSVISLFWTASRGISAVRRGLRNIYGAENPSFFKDFLKSIVLMFFVIAVILFLLIAAIFSAVVSSSFIISLVGFFILTAIFTLIYFLFTDRKFSFLSNLPGGVFASASWIIFIRIFSFYINNFSDYSHIYGSLTALFLIVLWIYFSTIIFFLASELNILLLAGNFRKTNKKRNC